MLTEALGQLAGLDLIWQANGWILTVYEYIMEGHGFS